MELLSIIKDVITSVVTLIGGGVAVLGYRTWHRQILGKTEHDIARNGLLAVLRVREEIRRVRSGAAIAPPPEQLESYGDADRLVDESWRKRLRDVFSERLDHLQERVVELQLTALEAEALWGSEVSGLIAPLTQLARELNTAVWSYFWLHGLLGKGLPKDPEHVRQNWAIVAIPSQQAGRPAPDVFGERVRAAVSELESYYRPKLRLERKRRG